MKLAKSMTAVAAIVIAFGMMYGTAAVFGDDEPDLDEIVKGVQMRYEKVNTYQVDFRQSLSSPVFKKVVREGAGTIYFEKPGKIRWEYDKPEKRLYLIDKEWLWDYDPQAKQVLKIPVDEALAGDVPHGFLFGAGNLKKDFTIRKLVQSTVGKNPGYRMSLEPKDEDLKMAVRDLVLVVDPKDYSVISSSFTDMQGNVNVYDFSNIKMNPKLDPELFMFKVPPGVKVILPVTPSEIEKENK